ncbi:hypothetical protein [Chitinophaga sp. OAE865]|uniref:hypothetical protein n=1 Tax=Chitinophaga sp. OAE865 TaxID=2817898 RepID=UPI001AEB1236
MKTALNIRGYKGNGKGCPVIPAHLPWYKKVVLTFFRFGVCPLCITMSVAYSIGRIFRRMKKDVGEVAG